MDALSEVLSVVQLRGAVFFKAAFTAPWCFPAPPASRIAGMVAPGAEMLVLYHYVTEGECTIQIDGVAPLHLVPGDVVMFPQGDPHSMSFPAATRTPPLDVEKLLRDSSRSLAAGGGGAATRFICGFLTCDPRLCAPILGALPRAFSVSLRGKGGDWL